MGEAIIDFTNPGNEQIVAKDGKQRNYEDYMKDKKEELEALRQELLDKLDSMGKLDKVSEDIVDDYIMWSLTIEKLWYSIDQDGAILEYNNGGGQTGMRSNPALNDMIKAGKQKLTVLSNLGLRPIDEEVKEAPKLF